MAGRDYLSRLRIGRQHTRDAIPDRFRNARVVGVMDALIIGPFAGMLDLVFQYGVMDMPHVVFQDMLP